MRDACRCLKAFILKALNIQWGHIYFKVAAAKDALQPNNNIPVKSVSLNMLPRVRQAGHATTHYWHNDWIFTEPDFLFHLSTCWNYREIEGLFLICRRFKKYIHLPFNLNMVSQPPAVETWRFYYWMSTGCQDKTTGSNIHQPASHPSTWSNLATSTNSQTCLSV